jgi:hypothetical protein
MDKRRVDSALASGSIDQIRSLNAEMRKANVEMNRFERNSIGAAAAMGGMHDSARNMVREFASVYAMMASTTYFKENIKAIDAMGASVLAVSDSAEEAGQTIGYIKQVIMDNGLSLKESTKDFVKLRAAMGGKYTLDETKQAFESLTKAGVVLQLSQEDMAGTVKAVSQMFGKQQIMAEELKNQLTLAA